MLRFCHIHITIQSFLFFGGWGGGGGYITKGTHVKHPFLRGGGGWGLGQGMEWRLCKYTSTQKKDNTTIHD